MPDTPLSALSHSLASVVDAVQASVVRVEARRRGGATGLVWSADGHVLTTSHAVEREEGLSVGLADGRSVGARLVGRDPSTDVALLQVEASGLAPLAPAPLEGLRVGHLVLALGRPGRSARATLGIVSALGEEWRTPAGGRIERYLETDADLPPGFSGGPLVDTSGGLLGLVSAALSRSAALAIPGATLARVAAALQEHGGVRRGYLGVSAYPVKLPGELRERAGSEAGLVLLGVEPGGPAHRAGLLLGDVLVSLDGQVLHDLPDLLGSLAERGAGTSVAARVLRAGEAREVSLTVGRRP